MNEKLKKEVNLLRRRVDCAMGRSLCDVLVKKATIADIANGRIVHDVDIAVDSGYIVDIGRHLKARALHVRQAREGIYVPGFIDSHVHIESSFLSPAGFSDLVLPFGTTTAVVDPHEIANVAGQTGLDYMLKASAEIPLDVRFMLPSCVPASPFESSGATLSAKDLEPYFQNDRILGLAEVMDVPAVLSGNEDMLKKLALARLSSKVVDGHAPLLFGQELDAYAAVGVRNDHEGSTPEELQERLAKGISVNMREGSAAQNVAGLAPGVNDTNWVGVMLCSDDAGADDVLANGHVNRALKKAVSRGIAPLRALAMAGINAARHYGIKDKGLLAPGFVADMVCVQDLQDFRVLEVWRGGKVVAQDGMLLQQAPVLAVPETLLSTMQLEKVCPATFAFKSKATSSVIGVIPEQIITERLERTIRLDENGFFDAQLNPGIVKIAVLERHHATGRIGLGLVEGYTTRGAYMDGAIATSVSHDAHNIIVAGDSDADMAQAVNVVRDMGGGMSVVKKGRVVATLALPIAGLMSDLPALTLAQKKRFFRETAIRELSIAKGVNPAMTLSFMALTAIPQIRITDKGLFDAEKFSFISENL